MVNQYSSCHIDRDIKLSTMILLLSTFHLIMIMMLVSGAEIRIMDRDFVAETNNSYVEGLDPNTLAPNYTMIDSQSRQELAWLLYGHLQHQTPGLAADAEPRIEQMDMAVLRLNNLTSVSVVPGYLSNEADRNEISSAEGQQKIALALAYAVRQYYVGP